MNAEAAKICVPIDRRRGRRELRDRHHMVAILRLAHFHARHFRFGELRFQRQDFFRIGARLRRIFAGQGEHLGNMVNILTTYDFEALVVAQVVIAVGQTELTGADRSDDHLAVLEVVLTRDAEQRRRAGVREVREFDDERVAVGDRIDAIERLLNRRDSGLIDGRFVHAR